MADIVIEGLDELLDRMSRFSGVVKREIKASMEVALLVFHETATTLGYPTQPAGSNYIRTHQLERSLSVGGSGNIHEISETGEYIEGSFGTNLEYASYVIGDYDTEQASHMRYWWTIPQDVLHRAYGKIQQEFQNLAEDLALFLAGKG